MNIFAIALILFVVAFLARIVAVIINPAGNKLTKFLSSVTILIPLATIFLSKDLIFFFSDVAIGFEVFMTAVTACLFLLFLCSCYQIYREYASYKFFIKMEQVKEDLDLLRRLPQKSLSELFMKELNKEQKK